MTSHSPVFTTRHLFILFSFTALRKKKNQLNITNTQIHKTLRQIGPFEMAGVTGPIYLRIQVWQIENHCSYVWWSLRHPPDHGINLTSSQKGMRECRIFQKYSEKTYLCFQAKERTPTLLLLRNVSKLLGQLLQKQGAEERSRAPESDPPRGQPTCPRTQLHELVHQHDFNKPWFPR